MMNLKLNYDRPWLLLLLIPAILFTLIPYFRVQKKYRCTRNRVISTVSRVLAFVLAINLLSGVAFAYEVPNEENEIILLVDITESNSTSREAKDEFVQTVINICDKEYRLGVVKFGYDAKYVVPLSDDNTDAYIRYLESEDPDNTATNLASALKYAADLFTNPQTGKIVVISDGIETDGAATSVIKAIASEGIRVDTVHFPNAEHDEIQIVSVELPEQHILVGEEFVLTLNLLSNFGDTEQVFTLRMYDNNDLVGEAPIQVSREDSAVAVGITLEDRGMHELRFEILHPGDTVQKNNAYYTYIDLKNFENVLLIERTENESQKLKALLEMTYQVTDMSVAEDFAEIPRDIRSLAAYEQVILVNIAYSDMPAGFEELLHRYVYDLGGGLFTVGGQNDIVNGKLVPHAYNRADIAQSTYFKQMLPVKAEDYTPPIAVMLVVDLSASMSMGKMEAALEGAEACLDALNDRDFCGIMSFETRATEELQILPVSQKEVIRETIRNIKSDANASGGTIFSDAIQSAGHALSVLQNVERKHIILVTDGNPGDTVETYMPYILNNVNNKNGKITMSVVTVGEIDSSLKSKMETTAEAGEGSFYNIKSSELHTIPTVMLEDLGQNAIDEIAYGEEFSLTVKDQTVVVAGIDEGAIPPLEGYYGTVAKKDAVVPLMGKYVPIYAQWKYGEGNVGSFMCDLNGIWSEKFISDVVGQAIVVNIVNSIFPIKDVRADDLDFVLKTDNYTTQLTVHGAEENTRVEVEVTPLSESLSALLDRGIPVIAAESNRRFTFTIRESGLYSIKIRTVDELGQVVTEVELHETFSYSQEYNEFPTKAPLGAELLSILAQDGKGIVVEDAADVFASFSKTLHKTYDPRVWMLILAILLILLDVAVRKFKFKWPHELVREYKQKKAESLAKGN